VGLSAALVLDLGPGGAVGLHHRAVAPFNEWARRKCGPLPHSLTTCRLSIQSRV